MYTLYYSPGACSMAVHITLNELGEKVKLEPANGPTGQRTPEFLKINPRGTVPVLVDDGHVIREGGAILSYILDKHESPLLPRSGKERATALEWLMFCNSTLHPAYARLFFAKKNFTGEVLEKTQMAFIDQINKLWKDVDERLSQSPYLAGKHLTVADILLTVIANWIPGVQIGAHTKKLLKSVSSRPSYAQALATEKVEYKAAA
jgi:glutathione S-transferase